MTLPTTPPRGGPYRWTFLTVALMSLVLLVKIAPDFGATWDEPQQRAKALRLIAYWEGHADSLNEPLDGGQLYGAPVDVLAAALEGIVPADPYLIRHEVIAVVAWIGILLCGLLADRLYGPPHGICSMILLTASPLYLAHATNNPKDVPFATVSTAVLLALAQKAPRPTALSWRTTVVLAVVIAVGMNVRPGALLFVAYVGVVVAYDLMRTPPIRLHLVVTAAARLAVVLGGAVALGWIAWPGAYGHPILAPFLAMAELGHFGWGGTVLFDGVSYPGTAPPPSYIPTWFWLTTPPLIVLGLILSVGRLRSTETRDPTIALGAALAFPLLYAAGTHATLYDGVRHLLFVVPVLTILAAAGWIGLWRATRREWRLAVVVALAAGLTEPLTFQWRNHPNQTAYIQPLAGGPREAFARYDLDYWGNCVLASLADVAGRAEGRPLYVTGWPLVILQADISRFPHLTLVEAADPRASYYIRLARGSRAELLSLASSPGVISRVATSDGALLCTVTSPNDARPPVPTPRR